MLITTVLTEHHIKRIKKIAERFGVHEQKVLNKTYSSSMVKCTQNLDEFEAEYLVNYLLKQGGVIHFEALMIYETDYYVKLDELNSKKDLALTQNEFWKL